MKRSINPGWKYFTVILMGFWGCAYGPKRENDTVVSYLDGNKYKQTGNLLGVPVLERQKSSKKIAGQIFLKTPLIPEPLKFQVMQLKFEAKTLLEARTDAQGRFVFSGDVPNGTYSIELVSNRYHVSHMLSVDRDDINNIQIWIDEKVDPSF